MNNLERYTGVSDDDLVNASRVLFEKGAVPVFMEFKMDRNGVLNHSWFGGGNFIHNSIQDNDILFRQMFGGILSNTDNSENSLDVTLEKYFKISANEIKKLYDNLANIGKSGKQETAILLQSDDSKVYSIVFVRRNDNTYQATLKNETSNVENYSFIKKKEIAAAGKILNFIEKNQGEDILILAGDLRRQLDSNVFFDSDDFFQPRKSLSPLRVRQFESWDNYLEKIKTGGFGTLIQDDISRNNFFDQAVINGFIAPEGLNNGKIISISKGTGISAKGVYDSYKDFVGNMGLGLDDQWAHRLQSFLEDPELDLCRFPIGKDVYSVVCAPTLTPNGIQTTMTKLGVQKDIYSALKDILSHRFLEDVEFKRHRKIESTINNISLLLGKIIKDGGEGVVEVGQSVVSGNNNAFLCNRFF